VLKIKDTLCEIRKAELCAVLPDPYWVEMDKRNGSKDLVWCLDIECVSTDESVMDGFDVTLSYENLGFSEKSWMQLEGQIVQWDKNENGYGILYVFEHEDITQEKIVFGKRNKFNYEIYWTGLCNIYWDEEYDEDLPFELTTEVKFTGVTVRACEKDNDNTIYERIARYLNPNEYEISPIRLKSHKYESGVRIAEVNLKPVEIIGDNNRRRSPN